MPENADNVKGIVANRERCRSLVVNSLMPVTALVPRLGYKEAANIAQEAHKTGKTVREVVLEKKLIPEQELAALLDLTAMKTYDCSQITDGYAALIPKRRAAGWRDSR